MQISPTKVLAVTVAIFFFTTNLSGTFLPVYLRESGLSVTEIVVVLFFTFLVIGLLPITLLRATRHFERIISLGILFTLLFYIALIYIKNPILLGLAYGLGIATFWPSFNLLIFRLSDVGERAFLISLLSVTIPSITGIVSPAVGGFIIESFGFATLFAASVLLYLAAFIVSLNIRYQPLVERFSFPKSRTFKLFLLTFVLFGMSESYWLAYPLFVFGVSTTVLNMGLVVAVSALVISVTHVGISRLSDVRRTRVGFAVVSSILYAVWYFALTQVSSMMEIVALSLVSGLASAFAISWLAHYGDSFERKYHPGILVMMETALMMGRILNLVPTYLYLTAYDFARYFVVLGFVSLLLIPFFVKSRDYSSDSA